MNERTFKRLPHLRPSFWRAPSYTLAAVALSVSSSSLLSAGVFVASVVTPTATHAQASVRDLPDFADLAERASPAVVNIRTTERRGGGAAGPGGANDEQLRELFRRFGIPIPNSPNNPDRRRGQPDDEESSGSPQQRGVGSGFIVSADGVVLTNAHVVDGADEVIVTLNDKREFKAKILGADKRSDVAVLKIEASGLATLRIGDANRVRAGEWVVAIGSPFGLSNTVTKGIVSAKQRDTGDLLPLIQTDVAINPGNSGGPLLNMRGEVVGINSQIYSRSGGFMGISFAIPIDEAMRVADSLRTLGRVVRGRIGVSIGNVSKDVAESIGLARAAGALVNGVERDGPAEKAGVEAGDIITRVDGKAIETSSDLRLAISNVKPGNKATLSIYRQGKPRDVGVTVGELDAPEAAASARAATPAKPDSDAAARSPVGVAVVDLTDTQKRELKVKGGVRVESVEGAGARAGLRAGDIVLTVDNQEVGSSQQFNAIVGKLDRAKSVAMLVRRGEATTFLVIRPGR
jgi:serine protease Do